MAHTVDGRPAVLTQTWAEIVWAHWPVPAARVAQLLPPSLRPDTFDGSAWVGFVPFEMRDLRLVLCGRRLPGIGSTRQFSEVNVRTYVIGPSGPGVWFHSLDATSALAVAVARGLWRLPYLRAEVDASHHGGRRAWQVRRPRQAGVPASTGALDAVVGEAAEPSPLTAFLCERYRLYAPLGRHRVLTAPVRHHPWQLASAELRRLDDGLVRAAGYEPAGPPASVLAGMPVEVTVGLPELLGSDPAR